MSMDEKKTILLVEDEAILAQAEKAVLEDFGYDVLLAHSGEEAVATAAKTPAIRLVLMDINLGAGIDGTEAAALILSQRDLPVVFLSGHIEPEIVARTEKITSYGYVAKGSSVMALQASIKMAFRLFEARIKEKAEESRKEAALETLARQHETMARLNQFAVELAVLPAEEDLETFITRRIKEFTGARAAIFSSFDQKSRTITIRNIEMEPGLAGKVGALLGKQLKKTRTTVSAEAFLEMTSKIIGTPKNLREASFGTIPHPVAMAIQALLKVERFIGIAYLVEGKLYGVSLLALGRDQPELPRAVLENFSFLAALSLRRNQVELQKEAALEALRESEERYRGIVDQSADGFVLTDGQGAVCEWNLAQETITQLKRSEVMGKPVWEVMARLRPEGIKTPGQLKEIQNIIESYLRPDSPWQGGRMEQRILCPDGSQRMVQDTTFIIKKNHSKTIAVIMRDISERHQAEEEIERQLAEKEILLTEVHHRIKNNIASIGALLALHLKTVSHPEAVAALQDAIGRVNSMALLYDKLLLTEGYKVLAVKNYIESLGNAIVAMFPDSARIKLDLRLDDFQLEANRLFPLGLITNELITNKMKYAFIGRDTGIISLTLKKENNQVSLVIQDNGNGLPAGFTISEAKGFGLTLVEMLSKQLAASFSMENQAGTRCTVEFAI